jgi:hypothetical protein
MKSTIRTATVALLIALTGPAIWAQKYPKRPVNGAAASGSAQPQVSLHIRSLKSHAHDLTPAQAFAPAPGVAQCHVDANGYLSGAFINTSTIPSGSVITGSITLEDDGSSIDFTGETLSQSLQPGSFVLLPTISSFGDLWYSSGAAFDIAVQVQPLVGATTEVDCQVLVGEVFSNSDLASNAPLISGLSQRVAGNNDLILVLSGYFTADPAQVVLTDLYASYVPPPSAITVVSGGEVDVDLSQIQGLDLTSSDVLFVTVGEDGFSDTVEYRYLPGTSGTFNLAPQ